MLIRNRLFVYGKRFIETEKKNKRRITEGELIKVLQLLGAKKGSILLLHISLSNLGLSILDVKWLLEVLWKVIGEDGKIVMPTFTYRQIKTSGSVFDVNKTRSDLGWTSEYFRCQSGVMRSVHPTHSVAAKGKFAFEITRHRRDSLTPFARGTPYDILYQRNALILFLGKSPRINTFYHAVEEWSDFPFLYEEDIYPMKVFDGKEEYYIHTKIHNLYWNRRFIEGLLLKKGILLRCKEFKEYNLYAASSRDLVDFILSKQKGDNYFFTENIYQVIFNICIESMRNLFAVIFGEVKYRTKIQLTEKIKFQYKKYIYLMTRFSRKINGESSRKMIRWRGKW